MKNSTTLLFLILASTAAFPLDVAFKVQETTNNPADDYPVTFAAPLPALTYSTTAPFRVTDANGTTVPAQISVLNRQWQIGYIRHLLITFKTSLAANEKKTFHLKDDGGNTGGTGLTLTETGADVTVITGPLKVKIKKQNFNLFDEVFLDINKNGTFESNEQLIQSSPDNGGILTDRHNAIQKSSDVGAPKITIEENGPIRTVIRVETPTVFTDTANIRHGYLVRLYAYAGKSYIKVEYTLKNSAFNATYSWPLYCKDFSLKTHLNLGPATVTIGEGTAASFSQALGSSGIYLNQKQYNQFDIKTNSGTALYSGTKAPGWLDASDGTKGVTVHCRYFWETWPNGLELDTGNTLYARMLPRWSAGYYWSDAWTRDSFVQSSTGLHWLDDMQHLTKEYLYDFHAGGVDAAQTQITAQQFWKNPVAVVPTSWWAQTRVTTDMGGIIPLTVPATSPASTDPEYVTLQGRDFGWPNFQGNIIGAGDRKSSCETGDIPFAAERFMATENPAYYYQDRAYVYGELNVRLEEMGGETDSAALNKLQFTSMPYSPAPSCNYSWRPSWSGYGPTDFKIVAPYLPGSGPHGWTSRDFEHMWIYNVEDFFYYDGMPVIKDWYRWIGQYIKGVAYDMGDNRVWRIATRGHGHALAALMGAYKMTGDSSFLNAGTHYVYKLRATQSKRNGQMTPEADPNGEGGLHVGYMTRAMIRYLEELKSRSCKEYVDAFGVLEGMIQWNYNWGHFCYYTPPGTIGSASGTAMLLADPQVWMYLHTGYTPYKTQAKVYADAKMYGDLLKWNLSSTNFPVFVGRLTQYAWENPRQDTIPPPAIADLSGQAAQPSGTGRLWVKADSLPANQTLHFAVRSFDSSDNMSRLSNIYNVNPGGATTYFLTWSAAPGAAYYHVKWCHKNIIENDSSMDTTINYHFWAANAIGNDINAPAAATVEQIRAAAPPTVFECLPGAFGSILYFTITTRTPDRFARLSISDISGRTVKSIPLQLLKTKTTIAWKKENTAGQKVSPGTYFVNLKGPGISLARRVLVID